MRRKLCNPIQFRARCNKNSENAKNTKVDKFNQKFNGRFEKKNSYCSAFHRQNLFGYFPRFITIASFLLDYMIRSILKNMPNISSIWN